MSSDIYNLCRQLTSQRAEVDRILDGWFGESLENAEDEENRRKHLYDPLRKLFAVDVEAAAKRLEKSIKQATYEWTDEEFEVWWNKDPRFNEEVHHWGYFSGTTKEKCIWEAKQVLGVKE